MKEKSELSHARLDGNSRVLKAQKIKKLLDDFVDFSTSNVLDVGTGAGVIATELSKHAHSVTSVDLYDERISSDGYKFIKVEDEKLPFEDKSFDIVLSNHVVEHIPEQESHIKELIRVCSDEGLIYIATPNRKWLIDPHYKIALINWLPRVWAGKYLKLIKGKDKEWDIYPVTSGYIKRVAGSAQTINLIPKMIKKGLESSTLKKPAPLLNIFFAPLYPISHHISPTLVYLIRKQKK